MPISTKPSNAAKADAGKITKTLRWLAMETEAVNGKPPPVRPDDAPGCCDPLRVEINGDGNVNAAHANSIPENMFPDYGWRSK